MRLVEQDDYVGVPSELLWRLLLRRQMMEECKDLKLDDFETRGVDFDAFEATGKLTERYDVPKYWFDQLVQEDGNTNPVEFLKSTEPHKNKRRKTWKKMWRDFSIYWWRKQGKSLGEIWRLSREKFDEDLDYGNIKKIVSDVRYRKLEIGAEEPISLE